MEGRSSFLPSQWKTDRLNEKTADPVFIVILGCEKTRATSGMCLLGSSV